MMVLVVIYFTGTVAGASQSRGSFRLRLTTNFPWPRVPGYILGQIAGGIAAAIFVRYFRTVGKLGATEPGAGVLQALLMEVLLTAGLVSTILGTASGVRNIGAKAILR